VIDQLREFGETRRGWLGVSIQDVTEDMAEALSLKEARGALVTDVPEGPAMEAGIEAGDVILSFDGRDVSDTRALVRQVGNTEVGKTVRVVVNREGKTETFRVTLGRREDAEAAAFPEEEEMPEAEEPSQSEILGMTLSPLTSDLRRQFTIGEDVRGLVVAGIDESSEAFEKGLRAGDVIAEAGQAEVQSISDLEDQIAEAREAGRKSLLLLVRREGNPRFVAVGLGDDMPEADGGSDPAEDDGAAEDGGEADEGGETEDGGETGEGEGDNR
jgi:serine protease Do